MVLEKALMKQREILFSKFLFESKQVCINPWLVLERNKTFLILLHKIQHCSAHLKVVDRLERVDARHEAVLEAEQSRLVVLPRVPRILTNQQKVRLQEAASKD